MYKIQDKLSVDLLIFNRLILHKSLTNIKIKKLLSRESSFEYYESMIYFFFKKSSTSSGDITLSEKVYAPVLGDLIIFIALVNLLEDVCKVATVFFAMTYYFISL
jgi:hypothetical protein